MIGYPVAYYIARHAGRTKNLLLILLIIPFWISYLMRMLAWVNLLDPSGYATRLMAFTGVSDLAVRTGLISNESNWLGGSLDHRHPGARLRVHPVPDPAALRLP